MRKKLHLLFAAVLFASIGFSQTNNTWKLVFEDNFDGSSYNKQFWSSCKRGNPNWKMYLVDSTATIQNNGSELVVRLIKNMNTTVDKAAYLSGGIESKAKFNFMYGKVEVRAKFNNAQGAWPAIWLMPEDDNVVSWPDCGEIDIMEHVNKEANVWQTIHTHFANGASDGGLGITNPAKSKQSPFISNDYNIYGLEWYPDRLDFLVNGVVTFTYPRISTTYAGQWPYDKNFYIILNMAGGGSWTGAITDSELPFEMKVDYVKVYQRDNADYVVPEFKGNHAQDDAFYKNTYLNQITSTGGVNNVSYTATARPSSYYTLYPDTIKVKANKNFTLNCKGYSLGAYSTTTVLQDLRYTCLYGFADFNGDKYFETSLKRIGNSIPTNGVGGNFGVLDTIATFVAPNSAVGKTGRIRLVYNNAWKTNFDSPELPIWEGLVYDFIVKVENISTAVENKQASKINVTGVNGKLTISGLNGEKVNVYSITGKLVYNSASKSTTENISLQKGLYLVKAGDFTGKVIL